VELDDRPSSLVDCLGEDGMTIDEAKLVLYEEKEDDLGDLLLQLVAASYSCTNDRKRKAPVGSTKKRAKRKAKAFASYYFDLNGNKVYLRPRNTYWYMMYVRSPPVNDNKFQVKFRRHF
jgi:hypothetical protein